MNSHIRITPIWQLLLLFDGTRRDESRRFCFSSSPAYMANMRAQDVILSCCHHLSLTWAPGCQEGCLVSGQPLVHRIALGGPFAREVITNRMTTFLIGFNGTFISAPHCQNLRQLQKSALKMHISALLHARTPEERHSMAQMVNVDSKSFLIDLSNKTHTNISPLASFPDVVEMALDTQKNPPRLH